MATATNEDGLWMKWCHIAMSHRGDALSFFRPPGSTGRICFGYVFRSATFNYGAVQFANLNI
jgi:hypothetical protein